MKNFNTRKQWREHVRLAWHGYRVSQWNQLPTLRLLIPVEKQPKFVQECATTQEIRASLCRLEWRIIPKPKRTKWFGCEAIPVESYISIFLVKILLQIPTLADLRRFLVAHPALVWGLGFPLNASSDSVGFDPDVALPTRQHMSHMLANIPNEHLQNLLSCQVAALQKAVGNSFGDVISLDTSVIIAWVKENNPKAYIKEGRFDKTEQPAGDSDCKLGCKRRHNRVTPTEEGRPGSGLPVSVGEFYWGYASGILVTKVPDVGEFVLAEMTQTFDKGDTTYFFPLMKQVEERLGFRPTYFTADAAFDAFYIFDYFHNEGANGFAAIPFSKKGGKPDRTFDENGDPVCDAGLSMSLKMTYNDNTTSIIPYRRQRYACPLLHPRETGQVCPVAHKKWPKGGCTTNIAESVGSRIRHQLDRESELYKQIYKQRTATERLFSQAKAFGIERPKLRNGDAIANVNTMTYLILNLRAGQKILNHK